ncbi:MAG: hypothetical protein H6748_20630 [Spirochaetaceae bacterium]|nr:hypothetical protein [Myxococcales bacterium]MCB9726467.1 hypothetical protein [Spirochaetaceae bacterium]HPG24841.1 hypothetical protein [Myxococcota bacterium]
MMRTRTMNTRLVWLAPILAAAQLVGCAGVGGGPDPVLEEADLAAVEEDAPLGGEALARRRLDLDRAWRDLQGFDATMRSLVDRKDSRSVRLLDDFLGEYMGRHLDPMLRPMWQSSHPETMALDANLRFMKAQILADMRYTGRVQQVIEDIESRYMGRESMLVEYPVGEQRPLGEALEMLRESKWNG